MFSWMDEGVGVVLHGLGIRHLVLPQAQGSWKGCRNLCPAFAGALLHLSTKHSQHACGKAFATRQRYRHAKAVPMRAHLSVCFLRVPYSVPPSFLVLTHSPNTSSFFLVFSSSICVRHQLACKHNL